VRIAVAFGTRPEAIKLFPVIRALQDAPGVELYVWVLGQHREMLQRVLALCAITPDLDLDIMTEGQTLADIMTRVLTLLPPVLAERRPDCLMVQGDTTSACAAALAAYFAKIPVAHIEAGLRSHDIYAPWPEEVNRRCISALATWHFAPTERAREVLLREGAPPRRVLVTGNTVIDALHDFRDRLEAGLPSGLEQLCPGLDPQRRLIVVTGHRRESFDGGIERVCQALLALARRTDVQIVFPVHPNPQVREPVARLLADQPNVVLLQPLDYLPFVDLLRRSYLILTDSGGIQEEAAALGKPALVMRDTTERPEGVDAGTARLVGTETARIVAEAERLLDDAAHHRAMSRAHDAYGDGRASARIVEALLARE